MIHELFLFLGGPKCNYDSCLDQNGGAGLKTCDGRVSDFWVTDTVISCGSVSDICANVCARHPKEKKNMRILVNWFVQQI
jgi:hypothetical protein